MICKAGWPKFMLQIACPASKLLSFPRFHVAHCIDAAIRKRIAKEPNQLYLNMWRVG